MIYPNIKRGGTAFPLGNNLFLMKGRKHKNGGIDIGEDLEVEGGEIMQTSPTEVKVFSAQKFLGGKSPAELILEGNNPNAVFNAQEAYKDKHKINDDGTKKKAKWGIFEKLFGKKKDNIQIPVKGNDNDFYTHAEKLAKYQSSKFNIGEEEALYNILNSKDYNYKGYFEEFGNLEPDSNGHFTDKYKTVYHDTFSDESIYSGKKSQYNPEGKIGGTWDNDGNFIKNKKRYDDMDKNKNNTSIPSAVGTNRSYWETVKENIQEYYNALKGNPFAEMIFPFRDVSEGNTMSMIPYMVPGYGIGKVLLKGSSKISKNFNKAAKIVNKEQSKKILRNISHIEDYEKSKLTDLYLHDNPKQRIESELIERYYRDLDLEAEAAEEFYYKHGYTIEDLLSGKINKYGGKHVNKDNAYILGYQFPFTGEVKKSYGGREKAALGKNKVIYKDGTEHYSTDANYDESQVDWNATDIYKGQRKLKTDHWLTTAIPSGIDLISGVTGAAINHATNNKYLSQMEGLIGKMKAYDTPLTKLKTHYNINPQLAEIENALGITKRDIDANTSSSQVGLARKRAAVKNAILEKNKLHGQKENIETQLINQDRLQQAETISKNIKNQQDVENQKLQMLVELANKRSENATSLISNITGAVSSTANRFVNGYNQYQQMLVGLAQSPNGADAILGQIGKQYRLGRKNKKKNNQDNS